MITAGPFITTSIFGEDGFDQIVSLIDRSLTNGSEGCANGYWPRRCSRWLRRDCDSDMLLDVVASRKR